MSDSVEKRSPCADSASSDDGGMVQRPTSCDLPPGTRLRWLDGSEVVLDRRKDPDEHQPVSVVPAGQRHRGGRRRRNVSTPFWPGWWLADNRGGLADYVIDDPKSGWEILSQSDGYPATD